MPAYAGLIADGVILGTNSVLTLDAERAVAAGEHVFVGLSNNGGSVNVSTVTLDGQSLAKDLNGPDSVTHIELWSGRMASSVASGADLVITLPSPVTVSIVAIAFGATGIVDTSPLDKTATNTGTSANPTSGTTAATVQADEFAVALAKPFGEPPLTSDAPFTEVSEVDDDGATAVLTMSYRVLTSIGTQQAAWTLGGSNSYDALIATYKALPDGAPVAWLRA